MNAKTCLQGHQALSSRLICIIAFLLTCIYPSHLMGFSSSEHIELGNRAFRGTFRSIHPLTYNCVSSQCDNVMFSICDRMLYAEEIEDHHYHSGVILTFGDLVALAGDYFKSPYALLDAIGRPHEECALKISPTDREACFQKREVLCKSFMDSPLSYIVNNEFYHYFLPMGFSKSTISEAEKKFAELATNNGTHFLALATTAELNCYASEWTELFHDMFTNPDSERFYVDYHCKALNAALSLGARAGKLAMKISTSPVDDEFRSRFFGDEDPTIFVFEAFALHYLSDSFAAGHVIVPRYDLQERWGIVNKFPYRAVNYMANRIAVHIHRLFPNDLVARNLYEALEKKSFFLIEFGDFIGAALHDYYNHIGVEVTMKGKRVRIYGDGELRKPHGAATRYAAMDAMADSLSELSLAFEFGKRGLSFKYFIDELKNKWGKGRPFAAQAQIPRLAPLQQHTWDQSTIEALLHDEILEKALAHSMPGYANLILAGVPSKYQDTFKREIIAVMLQYPTLFLADIVKTAPYEP